MAKKRYQQRRTLRGLQQIKSAAPIETANLKQAQTMKIQSLIDAATTMQEFAAKSFAEEAQKKAARTAIENDPITVLSATDESLSLEDQYANAYALKSMQSKILADIELEFSRALAEAEANDLHSSELNSKLQNIALNKFKSLREKGFDSPQMELDVTTQLTPQIARTIAQYEKARTRAKMSAFNNIQGKQVEESANWGGWDLSNKTAFDWIASQPNPELYVDSKGTLTPLGIKSVKGFKNGRMKRLKEIADDAYKDGTSYAEMRQALATLPNSEELSNGGYTFDEMNDYLAVRAKIESKYGMRIADEDVDKVINAYQTGDTEQILKHLPTEARAAVNLAIQQIVHSGEIITSPEDRTAFIRQLTILLTNPLAPDADEWEYSTNKVVEKLVTWYEADEAGFRNAMAGIYSHETQAGIIPNNVLKKRVGNNYTHDRLVTEEETTIIVQNLNDYINKDAYTDAFKYLTTLWNEAGDNAPKLVHSLSRHTEDKKAKQTILGHYQAYSTGHRAGKGNTYAQLAMKGKQWMATHGQDKDNKARIEFTKRQTKSWMKQHLPSDIYNDPTLSHVYEQTLMEIYYGLNSERDAPLAQFFFAGQEDIFNHFIGRIFSQDTDEQINGPMEYDGIFAEDSLIMLDKDSMGGATTNDINRMYEFSNLEVILTFGLVRKDGKTLMPFIEDNRRKENGKTVLDIPRTIIPQLEVFGQQTKEAVLTMDKLKNYRLVPANPNHFPLGTKFISGLYVLEGGDKGLLMDNKNRIIYFDVDAMARQYKKIGLDARDSTQFDITQETRMPRPGKVQIRDVKGTTKYKLGRDADIKEMGFGEKALFGTVSPGPDVQRKQRNLIDIWFPGSETKYKKTTEIKLKGK